jgi:hypothetical protein
MPGPKPVQPEPKTVTVPIAPAAVIQSAAQSLVADGFEIATSDATAGLLVAKRRATLDKAKGYVTCRWGADAPGAAGVDTQVQVTVAARAAASSSTVTITSKAKSASIPLHQTVNSPDASEENCATSGAAENHVLKAIGAAP